MVDGELDAPPCPRQLDADRRTGAAEIDGVGHQLVEHLRDEVGRAVDVNALRRRLQLEGLLRVGEAVAVRRTPPPRAARSKRSRSCAGRLCSRRVASLMRVRIVDQARQALLGALEIDLRLRRAAAAASRFSSEERTTAIGVRSSCDSRPAMLSR